MEDNEAGLEIASGDVLEFLPLIDWDHPRNSHRQGGQVGVPRWPLELAWRDGRVRTGSSAGSHHRCVTNMGARSMRSDMGSPEHRCAARHPSRFGDDHP